MVGGLTFQAAFLCLVRILELFFLGTATFDSYSNFDRTENGDC